MNFAGCISSYAVVEGRSVENEDLLPNTLRLRKR